MAQQQRRPQQQAQQHAVSNDDWNEADAHDLADDPYGMGGGGVVPEGWYDIQVAKAYVRTAGSSGLDYPNIEMTIINGDFQGRFMFCPLYINAKSDGFRKAQLSFLKRWFESCGQEIPDRCPEVDEDMSPIINCEASVFTIVEPKLALDGTTQDVNRVIRVCVLGQYETPQDERQQAAQQPAQQAAPQRQAAAPQRAAATPPARQARPVTATTRAAAPAPAPARGNGARQPAQQQQRRPQAAGNFNDMNDDIPF